VNSSVFLFALNIDEQYEREIRMNFIIAQIIGIVLLIVLVLMWQQTNKKRLLFFGIIGSTLSVIQYVLLNAITGASLELINSVRNIIFYFFEKNNKKPSVIVLIVFIMISIAIGMFTWQNLYSIIPIIVIIIYAYGLWQSDIKITRILACVYAAGITIYHILILAYTGAITSMIVCISIIISIIRYNKSDLKK